MQLVLRFTIACATISSSLARSLRAHPRSHATMRMPSLRNKTEPFQMVLKNNYDMSVLATINVGNQEVRCIPDTGSSEQVIFSDQCKECGGPMYSCEQDPDCEWGAHSTVQTYGSGQTFSSEAHSNVAFQSESGAEDLSVQGLMLWLVTQAELDFDLDGSMECIFGLGPASSAVRFAQMEFESMKGYLKGMTQDQARDYESTLHGLKQHLAFMRGVTLWQEASHVRMFSFCLHQQLGEDGTLIINDDAPERFPGQFVSVPTTTIEGDDLYWQIPMGRTHIAFDSAVEGCGGSDGCVAIMDTGTSLIGAPPAFARELTSALDKLIPQYGCEALHEYPDFNITLGAHTFTLSPRSYVCQFQSDGTDDDDDNWAAQKTLKHRRRTPHHRMPHLKSFQEAHKMQMNQSEPDNYYCAPCIFEMDDSGTSKPQWLFGLPFFREYRTTFQTTGDGRHTDKMLFAKASEDCRVDGVKDNLKEVVVSHGVQRIDPKKLRLPPMRGSKQRRR